MFVRKNFALARQAHAHHARNLHNARHNVQAATHTLMSPGKRCDYSAANAGGLLDLFLNKYGTQIFVLFFDFICVICENLRTINYFQLFGNNSIFQIHPIKPNIHGEQNVRTQKSYYPNPI